MNKNPFSIRKSLAKIIAAQAATLDDYLKLIPIWAYSGNGEESIPDTCSTTR